MADYELEGNTLIVAGSLESIEGKVLHDWCRNLLGVGSKSLIIDLQQVTHLSSGSIATLSDFWLECVDRDCDLIVIVSPAVRRVLTIAGFHYVFDLRDGVEGRGSGVFAGSDPGPQEGPATTN